MSEMLFFFLVTVVAPLFLSSWRASLLGLSLQGLFLAGLLVREHPEPSMTAGVLLIDLVVVRGALAPIILYRHRRAQGGTHRLDLIPANLVHWGFAVVLLALGTWFGIALAEVTSQEALHLSVAAAALLMGLFVLATQTQPLGQAIGALIVENGVVLFEMLSGAHPPGFVQLAVTIIFVLTVWRFSLFLDRLASGEPNDPINPASFL